MTRKKAENLGCRGWDLCKIYLYHQTLWFQAVFPPFLLCPNFPPLVPRPTITPTHLPSSLHRMKEKEARAKFRQIVSAVQYCHQKKIIHRCQRYIQFILPPLLLHSSCYSGYVSFILFPPFAPQDTYDKDKNPQRVYTLTVFVFEIISE